EGLPFRAELIDHLLRAAYEQVPIRTAAGIEFGSPARLPAALATDTAEHAVVRRIKIIPCALRIFGDVAVLIDADLRGVCVMPGFAERLPVQPYKGLEAGPLSADDCQDEGQVELRCAHHGCRRAADGYPNGQRLLHRPRINAGAG